MKASESFAVGLAMLGQLSCAAPQVAREKKVEAPAVVQALPVVDEGPSLPDEVTAAAARAATAVEKCLEAHGGRISLEVSPNEAYIAETIRPTGERPEVGMRIGQYFMCDDSNQKCGVAYAMPNQYADNFGPKLERWGLEAMRFQDVSPYSGKMTGADGRAERMFDFNLPPQGDGHEAVCIPMPKSEWAYGSFADRRPSSPGLNAHTDLFGCQPSKTPKLTRAYFQEIYRGILVKLAKACANGGVKVPGDKYVRPVFQGRGLGAIDTGAGTGRF